MNFQELPDIVIEKIFSYLTYNQIAENRIISRKFNDVGREMLNRGYYMVERFHRKSLKAVKSKLPRRESERKIHPLSRQCDILIAVETRLSMLSMTFIRYIEGRQCCFIPGKVIDELLRVLRFVNTLVTPPHDLLQELRDITSMAMEHFDEKIAPHLKEKLAVYRANTSIVLHNDGNQTIALPTNLSKYKALAGDVRQMISRSKSDHTLISSLSYKSKRILKQTRSTNKSLNALKIKLAEQQREIHRQRRLIHSWEAKFRDLTTEVRGLSRRATLQTFPLSGENMEQRDDVRQPEIKKKLKKRKLLPS